MGTSRITLVRGDITKEDVDAIVNAANSTLLGGGGVDGAIHRAGGPAILAECLKLVVKHGPLPPGGAVITGAGRMQAKHVIHTVGPIWKGGNRGEPEALRSAYLNSLKLAEEHGLKTVSFSSISTGAFGYPVAEAAGIAVKAIAEHLQDSDLEEVRMVLFDDGTFAVYSKTLADLS